MALDPVRVADSGDEPMPTLEEATAALALAREVVAAVHARLPAETLS